MADQGLASPNMDESKKEEIHRKGGEASRGGGRSGSSTNKSSTSGRGSKEGQIKGGKHSHDNQYT